MPQTPLDVGIIGAGTAGLATALFLSRGGHRVTLYERVSDPAPVGAGIVIQPTGQSVLARLGLFEEIIPRGARIDSLHVDTAQGRPLLDLQYAALSDALYGVGMHRGVLFQQLFAAVSREPVSVRLAVPCERLAPANGGHRIIDEHGQRHGPHQLIVIADGSRSRFREAASMPKRVRAYAWGALWFVGCDPERRFTGRLYQVVRGTDHMLGLLPTGFGPDRANETPLVSLYWSMRGDRVDAWRRDGLDSWKRLIHQYAPAAEALLEQIVDPEQVLYTSYYDVAMYPWHSGSVVYVGDAAHAMSPQLGQGCNLALWDAMVLSECLAREASIAPALDAYSRERKRHLRFYQFATRWLTPFFQSDYRLLGWGRDVFMSALAKLPPVHRQMVRSMAGVMRGIVRPALPISPIVAALPAPRRDDATVRAA